MKVKCPDCGRIFDVPTSQLNRMLRCVCKASFKAEEIVLSEKEIVDSSNQATPKISADAPSFSAAQIPVDDETIDSEATLSDTEVGRMVAALSAEKNRSTAAQQKSSLPMAKRPMAPIEVDNIDEPTLMRNMPPKEGLGSESPDNTIFQARKQLEEREEKRKRKATEPKRDDTHSMSIHTITHRMNRMFKERTVLVLSIAGAVFIFVVLMIALRPQQKVAEAQDPYLSKLLTPKVQEPERMLDKDQPSETNSKAASIPPAKNSEKPGVADEPSAIPVVQKMKEATFQGDYEDVIRIAAGTTTDLGEEGRALLLEAQLTRAGRNRTRVREIYLRLADERRNHPNASSFLRTQAVAMLRNPVSTQDLYTALDILKSLALTRSQDPLVFDYLGETYERLGRLDLAHAQYEEALVLEPRFTWILEHRMELYSKAGQEEKASEMAERLTKFEDKSYDGLVKLAELNFKKGNPAQGIAHYRRALQLDDEPEGRLGLGMHLKDLGKYEEALKEFEAGLKKSPSLNLKQNLSTQAGSCLCKKKSYSEGLTFFQKALAVKSNGGAAHIFFERGQCEMNMGQNKKAAHSFQSSLKYNPNAAETWLFYGAALLRTKQPRAAIDPLKHSIKLKPTDQSYYFLSLAYVQQGQKKEAKVAARQALKLNPKNREAAALLPKLH